MPGDYEVRLVRVPGEFFTAAGDEGGVLTNGLARDGVITLGDDDFWTFTASAGETVRLRGVDETPSGTVYPWLRVYSPSGAFIRSGFANPNETELTFTAPASGVYTLLVGSYYQGYAGEYRVTLMSGP